MQLTEGRELTEQAGLSPLIDFSYADCFMNCRLPDASFDVWWCQEALLYLDRQAARLSLKAMRVVRPGGPPDHVAGPFVA